MNREEFDSIRFKSSPSQTLNVCELINQQDRTLIWGYDCSSRNDHHVYLMDGLIYIITYNTLTKFAAKGSRISIESVVPNKRIYPEACDLEFCELLLKKNVVLPFTEFSSYRKPQTFYGAVLINDKLKNLE